MDTDQVILCSHVDINTNKDKPTGQVNIYNLRNGQCLSPTFKEAVAERGCVALLDGMILQNSSHFLAFSPSYSTFQIYNFAKEKAVSKFFGHEKLTCVASDISGQYVVAGTVNGSVFVWQVSTGSLVNVLNRVHFQQISRLSFCEQYMCSASADGTVKVWEKHVVLGSKDAVPLYSFAHHTMHVSEVRFGLVGGKRRRLFTSGLDGSALVYDMHDGTMQAKFTFPSPAQCMTVNAVETFLAVGGDNGVIYCVDLEGSAGTVTENMDQYGHHQMNVKLQTLDASTTTSICFSLDASIVISGHQNGSIIFWDILNSRQPIRQVTSSHGAVTNIHCLLRNPIVINKPARTFSPFKRNADAESELLLELTSISEQAENVKTSKSESNNASNTSVSESHHRISMINKTLFEFIQRQTENNK
jgi:pre-rRNA-processing protein IPI3